MNSATPERQVAVPVVQGRNRLRGNALGWLYDDNPAYPSTTARVRAELATAARSNGVEPTDVWLRMALAQLLAIFDREHCQHRTERTDGVTGFVYDAGIGGGVRLLMAERPTLERVGHSLPRLLEAMR
ncbi:MAG: hypothetical protein L6Q73_17525 [Aquabacterium sp.]|nr:hypothetical protein [Aquabacterium sp.]